MVDIGVLVVSVGTGFAITMTVWFFVWGISKAIGIFKTITKV
jgi:hypothetical protein